MSKTKHPTASGLCDRLQFCGCGRPELALIFLRDLLSLFARLRAHGSWDYDAWQAEIKKLLPNEGSQYLVFYIIDRLGLTEHGGSVPGWLTKEGDAMLADLEKLYPLSNPKP